MIIKTGIQYILKIGINEEDFYHESIKFRGQLKSTERIAFLNRLNFDRLQPWNSGSNLQPANTTYVFTIDRWSKS